MSRCGNLTLDAVGSQVADIRAMPAINCAEPLVEVDEASTEEANDVREAETQSSSMSLEVSLVFQ